MIVHSRNTAEKEILGLLMDHKVSGINGSGQEHNRIH
jgi:calcineurin-like phosphoesterase